MGLCSYYRSFVEKFSQHAVHFHHRNRSLSLRHMTVDNDPHRTKRQMDFVHKDGSRHTNADALSHRPMSLDSTELVDKITRVHTVGGRTRLLSGWLWGES